jgi:hypothetical protein
LSGDLRNQIGPSFSETADTFAASRMAARGRQGAGKGPARQEVAPAKKFLATVPTQFAVCRFSTIFKHFCIETVVSVAQAYSFCF